MPCPIVFLDFAGPADASLENFYSSVFDWNADGDGKFPVPVASPIECAIRRDPAEKRVYIGVPDVAGYLVRIEEAGGKVDVPRFEVPGTVVLGLFSDPAGNPMGLVEMAGEQLRVP